MPGDMFVLEHVVDFCLQISSILLLHCIRLWKPDQSTLTMCNLLMRDSQIRLILDRSLVDHLFEQIKIAAVFPNYYISLY